MPRKQCVLVCEDDPAMVRIFQFLLRQQGVHTVLTTTRGETVVSMVEKQKPDLVLLDLMLPGKDGLTVLKELKGNEQTGSVPVIVVSGKESQMQVREAMAAGAVDYVVKPFEPKELGLRIRHFFETIQPLRDSEAGSEPSAPNPSGGAPS